MNLSHIKRKIEELLVFQSNPDQGKSPITGKAGRILLSIELGCCILLAFLVLEDFCQSVHTFGHYLVSQSVASSDQELKDSILLALASS
jgi:hypothetical protein